MDSPAEALAQSEKDATVDSSKPVGQGSKPAGQGSKPQLFTWGLGKSGQLGTGTDNFFLSQWASSLMSHHMIHHNIVCCLATYLDSGY